MGADGNIRIWSDEVVREAWPNCDELFEYFNAHYCHQLEGKKYHHIYSGDNGPFFHDWPENVPPFYPETEQEKKAKRDTIGELRLYEFEAWLEANATFWEVWT